MQTASESNGGWNPFLICEEDNSILFFQQLRRQLTQLEQEAKNKKQTKYV